MRFQVGVCLGVLFLAGRALADSPSALQKESLPMSGEKRTEFREFDATLVAHLKERNIQGASIAVAFNGRLVYVRGYGYADRDKRTPVQPNTLFRLASVSKPITSVAIMTLVQNPRYRLSLDAKVFSMLGYKPFLKAGQRLDRRIMDITVRQLLEHSGGWDRAKSGDIMFKQQEIARDMGVSSPPDTITLIRWAMGRTLDFDPGTHYAYSNFGYCVLGRLIEKLTGMTYEKYVQSVVLAPASITQMRIGKGRENEKFSTETRYYAPNNAQGASIFSQDNGAQLPLPYSFASPETMDAHGGWVSSAVDLMRLATALDGTGKRQILTPEAATLMYQRPRPPLGLEADGSPSPAYYALGWMVRPNKGKANYWHGGGMPGTATIWVRLESGLSWAALFNQDDAGDIDGLMHRAARTVKNWDLPDLFAQYP